MFENIRVLDHYKICECIEIFEEKCEHYLNLWNHYINELKYNDIDELEIEMVEWLEKNTTYKVYYGGDLEFKFEDETDLVAFKLRWF